MPQGFMLAGIPVRVSRARTVVIGSGCAGFNAADSLYDLGERDLLLMTEDMRTGTSRNAGSDKQTYYKLSLCGGEPDSVDMLAQTLYAEGVHGDTALIEAANSARCFLKLAQLGVPFPHNAFGEYAGYRTDHDPRCRATSAGPLTSMLMTERLEAQVRAKGIALLDRCAAFHLLVREGRLAGVLGYDRDAHCLHVVCCAHAVLATGGPAQVYAQSVYPLGHTGMSGMALAAGAAGANLHQWQYGLASTAFRWNVSGSYQQVLPRYVSVDEQGVRREFLAEALGDPLEAVRLCFLKGYQWPFDTRKLDGSSIIDLLIHRETAVLGRRVYMDFTENPSCLRGGLEALDAEAYAYLHNSGAVQGTPIARLLDMNAPAVALYRDHGIDLAREPLEVRVCAQHHNGGLAVDADWQTTLPGLYAAGEAAGTFGAYRPGGSALNATQVGGLRAAQHIAWVSRAQAPEAAEMEALVRAQWPALAAQCGALVSPQATREDTQRAMSAHGAHLRDLDALAALDARLAGLLAQVPAQTQDAPDVLPEDFLDRAKLRDQLLTQRAVIDAMLCAARVYGSSGAGLVLDAQGEPVLPGSAMRARAYRAQAENLVLTTRLAGGGFATHPEPARPMPVRDLWFEQVWREYRERTEGAVCGGGA